MSGKKVQVIATARGFDGLCVREEGDKFSVSEEVAKGSPVVEYDEKTKKHVKTGEFRKPTWFKLAEEKVEEPAKGGKKDKKPEDLV